MSLKIFEDFDETNLMLTHRFSVSEPLVSIEGWAGQPVADPYHDDGHQISFKVFLGSVSINDPLLRDQGRHTAKQPLEHVYQEPETTFYQGWHTGL